MYSQNNEDDFFLAHFNGIKGTIVEIGANDGQTLSNSKLLIENGWEGHLFEPSVETFTKLEHLHFENSNVFTYPFGIAKDDGKKDFYVSGQLLGGEDKSLVSCINPEEMKRWGNNVEFDKTTAMFFTWQSFLNQYNYEQKTFDVISLDAEGEDWNILQQIDLYKHKCGLLCVEWNSKDDLAYLFDYYAKQYGMREVKRNAENMIFAK